jgi:hypothetical protein
MQPANTRRKDDGVFTQLFGADGDRRQLTAWVTWFKAQKPHGLDALEQLEYLGRLTGDRNTVISLLMEVHRSLYLRGIAKRKFDRSYTRIRDAATLVGALIESTARYETGLVDDMSGAHRGRMLYADLLALADACESQVEQVTSAQENAAAVRWIADLNVFVKDRTRRYHDDEIGAILRVIFKKATVVNVRKWREHHTKAVKAAVARAQKRRMKGRDPWGELLFLRFSDWTR